MKIVKKIDWIRSIVMLVLGSVWLLGALVVTNGMFKFGKILLSAWSGGEYNILWAMFSIPLSFMCLITWVFTELMAITSMLLARGREKYIKQGRYRQYENSFMVTNIVTTILFLIGAFVSMAISMSFFEGGDISYIRNSTSMKIVYMATIYPIGMVVEMVIVSIIGLVEFTFCLTNKGEY